MQHSIYGIQSGAFSALGLHKIHHKVIDTLFSCVKSAGISYIDFSLYTMPSARDPQPSESPTADTQLRDSNGWDGKLRVDRRAVISNPEALSDPDYSDEDAPPVEQIDADEGRSREFSQMHILTRYWSRSS